MSLTNVFIGAPQSKFAALAILVALGAIVVAILFSKDVVPIGQKFMFVLLLVATALPAVLLTLFQLTCLVTGAGLKNQRWWCSAYALIGTILIVIYAAVLVVIAISSIVSGSSVTKDLASLSSTVDMNAANEAAKEFFEGEMSTPEQPAVGGEMVMPEMPELPSGMPQPPLVDTFEGEMDDEEDLDGGERFANYVAF